MDLLSLGKEMLQSTAEQAASYRIGQSVLRYIDKGLWVVEKCARWAVPPPLDQDERPQPELIRPLPWVFFLAMLVALRVTRESISLLNLMLGKPPLRSADVVMFIQSKRRYLRTLKYQGNRIIRSRNMHSRNRDPWYAGLRSLFEFTMCFRSHSYGNNNTTRVSNNDEVLVVKRKRPRDSPGPVTSTADESTMERLIDKMMVQLDASSDDDSSFTLTNARSDYTESEEDSTIEQLTPTQTTTQTTTTDSNDTAKDISNITEDSPVSLVAKPPNNTQTNKSDVAKSPHNAQINESEVAKFPNNTQTNESDVGKTPNNTETNESNVAKPPNNAQTNESDVAKSPSKLDNSKSNNLPPKVENGESFTCSTPEKKTNKKDKAELSEIETIIEEIRVPEVLIEKSVKEEAQNFLANERCSPQKNDRSPKKIANGRTSNKKRDLQTHARSSDNIRTTVDRL